MADGLFASWPGRVAVGEKTAGCKNKDGGINWISIYILMLMGVFSKYTKGNSSY